MMSLSLSSRLALVLLVFLRAEIAAAYQSPVPSPTWPPPAAPGPGRSAAYEAMDCTALLFGAADCLTYLAEGSNLTVPGEACCRELAILVTMNPICLCGPLKMGNAFGIGIDITRAIGLPSACKVDTPDPNACDYEQPPTGEALPSTTVNKDEGAAAIIGQPTSRLLLGLVAVAAFTWNMF